MSIRVQVVMEAEEREAFRRRAAAEDVSLSAWLREAGRRRLAGERPSQISTPDELRDFFAATADGDDGAEPDWVQHLATIDASRREGAAPA